MEQTNMVLAMYQAMAAQGMVPKTGKNDKSGDFQKLLDQKSQSQAPKSDAPVEEKPKADGVTANGEKAPAREDDPLEQIKKLAEQGCALAQSAAEMVPFDADNVAIGKSETGEYVVMQLGEEGEVLSVIELDPWQQQQLQQLMHNMELMDSAKDPQADAMLEATDPAADHSPAKLLEKVVDDQTGKTAEQTVEEAKPQEEKKDEVQVELLDVDQGPRQIFHDVKAAPIKVAEAPETEQPQNVAQQIDAGLAQAMQKGDSLVRIQLTPENLGEVTVEISQSAEGVLKVALTAGSADTRSLLERHANDLQGMLNSRTQQTVEVSVQRQQESQQNQNQQHSYDGRNGHAQDGQERRQRREHASNSQDFMQQLRLGLIPDDGGI